MRIFQHRVPLIGEVNFLLSAGGVRRSWGLYRLGGSWLSLDWCFKFRHGLFDDGLRVGGNFHHGHFRDGRRWRFRLNRRGAGCQFRVGETGGALESAAKLAEALGTTQVGALDMDLLELGSQFGGAAIVSRAEYKVEKLFESGSVARRAAQDSFEKSDSFLGEAVAGKKIDVCEGLSDELLGLFVKLRLGRSRGDRGLIPGDGCKSWLRVRAQLWRRSLGDFCLEIFFGSDWLRFGAEQAHLAEAAVQFALG
jgi:hypothetical protein